VKVSEIPNDGKEGVEARRLRITFFALMEELLSLLLPPVAERDAGYIAHPGASNNLEKHEYSSQVGTDVSVLMAYLVHLPGTL
jgi:hypothetical protein